MFWLLYLPLTPEGDHFPSSTGISRRYTERGRCIDLLSFMRFMDSRLCTLPRGVGVRKPVWLSYLSLSLSLFCSLHPSLTHWMLLFMPYTLHCSSAAAQMNVMLLKFNDASPRFLTSDPPSQSLNVRPFDERLHLVHRCSLGCSRSLSASAIRFSSSLIFILFPVTR